MSTLSWPVKNSLIAYALTQGAGTVTVADGAVETERSFEFPGDDSSVGPDAHRFRGSVLISAHDGLLSAPIVEPWLERGVDGWDLTIRDPEDAASRIVFARVAALEEGDDGVVVGADVRLTAGGAELFVFGPYAAGTPFDGLRILP